MFPSWNSDNELRDDDFFSVMVGTGGTADSTLKREMFKEAFRMQEWEHIITTSLGILSRE